MISYTAVTVNMYNLHKINYVINGYIWFIFRYCLFCH